MADPQDMKRAVVDRQDSGAQVKRAIVERQLAEAEANAAAWTAKRNRAIEEAADLGTPLATIAAAARMSEDEVRTVLARRNRH